MKKIIIALLPAILFSLCSIAQEKNEVSIAFYNFENLFDTIDSNMDGDFDWTPGGNKIWNTKRYTKKLENLAYVIEKLDGNENLPGPDLLGFCEVENRTVVEDLIKSKPINSANYGIVHYEGSDKRGIDVGLLYRTDNFEVTHSKSYKLIFEGEDYHTREQLMVTGNLYGEKVNVIVNHWPSRRGGPEKSNYRRVQAAKLTKSIVDSIIKVDAKAKIIIMGDFNDDPSNESISQVLGASVEEKAAKKTGLYNPLAKKLTKTEGSLCYRDVWFLFDQILITPNMISGKSFQYESAHIFNDESIQVQGGKYDGHPLRTHAGAKYLRGYSDHFPVFIKLSK
jgi:predicted extracellular nuclease